MPARRAMDSPEPVPAPVRGAADSPAASAAGRTDTRADSAAGRAVASHDPRSLTARREASRPAVAPTVLTRVASPIAQGPHQGQILTVFRCLAWRLENQRDATSSRMPKQFGERFDANTSLADALVIVAIRSARVLGVVGMQQLQS